MNMIEFPAAAVLMKRPYHLRNPPGVFQAPEGWGRLVFGSILRWHQTWGFWRFKLAGNDGTWWFLCCTCLVLMTTWWLHDGWYMLQWKFAESLMVKLVVYSDVVVRSPRFLLSFFLLFLFQAVPKNDGLTTAWRKVCRFMCDTVRWFHPKSLSWMYVQPKLVKLTNFELKRIVPKYYHQARKSMQTVDLWNPQSNPHHPQNIPKYCTSNFKKDCTPEVYLT